MITSSIFFGSLAGAILIGMPIAFALLLSSAALMWHMDMLDGQIIAQNLINGANSFSLLALPFFLLAGELMNAGGLSRRIIAIPMAFFGHLRGGLGYVCIVSSLILSSMSGSAIADAAVLSAMLIPVMREAGYPLDRSGGLIAASGLIAPIFPPSIPFIIFGVTAGVSITKLFIAGIFPALLLALALLIAWRLTSRRSAPPPLPRRSRLEIKAALRDAGWAMGMPVMIIGGLRFGVFTPTEAGVFAAAYALLIGCCVYRELHLRELAAIFVSVARTTALLMFLIAAAFVSSWIIAAAQIPDALTGLLEPLISQPTLLLLAINAVVFLVGTVLDLVPAILLLTPILMPLILAADIDPVYFGVLFILNNTIGLITPPVGPVLNTVCSIGNMSMYRVIRGVMPFLAAETLVLLLLILFPALVTVPAQMLY